MEGVSLSNNVLFIGYGSSLQVLASFFLVQDVVMLSKVKDGLPVDFLIRFGVFWFSSIVLALLVFLVYLRLKKLYLTEADKLYMKRFSKSIMLYSVISTSIITAGFLYLHW